MREGGSLRVLMFGWEYPPRFSGGLGVACQGLVRGLQRRQVRLALVLPRDPEAEAEEGVRYLDANDFLPEAGEWPVHVPRVWPVLSPLHPYLDAPAYAAGRHVGAGGAGIRRGQALQGGYGASLREEVSRYAQVASRIALAESFDVIHAHDWMTFPAAEAASRASGKPFVAHVHATEYDRSGGPGDPWIASIEREGLHGAGRVICVSRYTADIARQEYGVPEEKLTVIHNAIEPGRPERRLEFSEGEPVVLFSGRLTLQKGPDYFIEAARLVLAERPDARFVLAGDGDMKPRLLSRVAEWRLGDRILFTGFLDRSRLERLYRRADLYVLPSVSEPFGLTVLEALRQGTPVILSRRAGVAEVVRHALRVDFWDTRQLAGKILSVLAFRPLSRELSRRGSAEVERLSWSDAAARCVDVYREVLAEGDAR